MTTDRVRPVSRAFTILIAALMLAPVATASHWVLYETTNPGTTYEDDGRVVSAPGNPLHGRENRVTASGAAPGSGGLFLDARLGTDVRGIHVFGDVIGAAALGRTDVLAPGGLMPTAWYGWWNDLDLDGTIDDVLDASCEGHACPGDEFTWRGAGSGETVGMIHYMIPFVATYPFAGGGPTTDREGVRITNMEDHTDTRNPSQEWVGAQGLQVLDGSTLATIQTVTVAGAQPTPGGAFAYDLDDPAGLIDVDRYEAVSPETAALWSTALGFVANPAAISGAAKALINDAGDIVSDETKALIDAIVAADAEGTAFGAVDDTTVTPYAKEPNTFEDDYGGRALFGGVGDFAGSGNSYDAYAAGHHFYIDVLSRLKPCGGAFVHVPGTSVTNGAGPVCLGAFTSLHDPRETDAEGRTAGGSRSTGTHLTFTTRPVLWRDFNGDTHVGNVCDPESAAFDAARNTCDPDASGYPYPWPNSYNSEIRDVCSVTTGRETGIVLTPVGGNWPNVIVHRDYGALGRSAESAFELRSDGAPIVLEWAEGCEGNNSGFTVRDAVIFPPGASTVPVRVEVRLGIIGFRDVGAGIDVGAETVVDVDYLAASF